MALGHVIVLLQHEWPRGENLFLKAINKICQQGNFQYENFFNYVTSILFPIKKLSVQQKTMQNPLSSKTFN